MTDRSRIPTTGAVATLAALAIALAAGCEKPGMPAGMKMERPPAAVTVATAESRDVPVYVDHIGRAAPRELVSVHPQASGAISKIHFEDGAEVKAGELLFTIDSRPYEAALHQTKAALAQAEAELELARLDWKRLGGLEGSRAVSQADIDAKHAAVDVGEAQVAAARAAIETAEVNLGYCTIRSPIEGRTGQRQVDIGNVVSAGGMANAQTTLVVIQRLDPIYADFTIPETELARVRAGMARGTLHVEVRVPDATTVTAGDLTFLDSAVLEASGTVKLRATVANGERRLWPGQFVNVRLILERRQGAVLVPVDALQLGQTGPYVYVVKADDSAELRPVTPGQRQGDLVVIDAGLAAGERVITTGQLAVMPGAKVAVRAPAGAAAGAGAPAGGKS